MDTEIESNDDIGESILDTYEDDLTVEKMVIAVSAASAIAGSFSPWVFTFDATTYGIEGSGVYTLFLAIVGALIVNYYDWDWRAMVGCGITGVLIASISLYNVRLGAAYGVYVTLLGGIGLLASSMYGFGKVDPRTD